MTFNPKDYPVAVMQARQDAIAKYPNESCGIIVCGDEYIPLENVSQNPTQEFDCQEERLSYMLNDGVVAMVHSHPYPESQVIFENTYPADFGPSEHDMRQQLADNIPWGVIATNGKTATDAVFWGDIPEVPLEGRLFRHGPTGTDGRGDCYALIKDYYQQKLGITLPEGPRDYKWWHHNENLYVDNMKRAGFSVIPKEEAKEGDIFFAQVNSTVPNHGGVLLQGGLILHHLSNRVSGTANILPWRKSIVTWIRHKERT